MPMKPNQRKRRELPPRSDYKAMNEWEQAVEHFITSRRAIPVKETTVQLYRWTLLGNRLTEWRADHQINEPKDMNLDRLNQFQAELADPKIGLSMHTVKSFHRILMTFMRFCRNDEKYGVEDSIEQWPDPKAHDVRKEVFTPVEIEMLVAAADNERDKFIIRFLDRSGVRLKELTAITLDDFSDDYSRVKLTVTKGDIPRTVFLDTKTHMFSRHVKSYIRNTGRDKSGRPTDTNRRELLLTTKRFNGDYKPLEAHSIQSMLRRCGKKVGIRVGPHTFRHTYATRMAGAINMLALQKQLGHSTPRMTAKYYNPTDDMLAEEFKKAKD